jgi:MoaA/NifB/PqqE/SkfB family radical SAM enzyme
MRLLCNDLVINEDSCNLACSYCLTGQSNLKQSHRQQLIFSHPRRESLKDEALRQRLYTILERFDALYAPPMLKITGGEIFLIEGIEEFIVACSQRYRKLIVQTNGMVATDRQIAALEGLPNLVVQISLDSHLHHGNAYRVQSRRQHDKMMERIGRFFSSRLPVEIYCVVNDCSIETLSDFGAFLQARPNPPQLTPFPVRGPDASRFAASAEQLHLLDSFVAMAGSCPDVMPPSPYLARLVRFYADRRRDFGCHLPRFAASTFGDGMLTPCPNIWFSNAGNLTDRDWRETGKRLIESGVRKALLAPMPRLDACKGCFTPWDSLSMYFDGELTLEELCRSHAYSGLEAEIERFKLVGEEFANPCA